MVSLWPKTTSFDLSGAFFYQPLKFSYILLLKPLAMRHLSKFDHFIRNQRNQVNNASRMAVSVQQIGKAASRFIQEDIKMDNVYDYMFHLLTAYSKLMKYKPTVPENATELCSETMGCTSEGFVKQLMDQSTVNGPANVSPCIMQPPYDPQTLNSILGQNTNSIKQVEK
ncbi:lipopolysaccharide-modifying protein [Artemisia annua]|uniref:Lipopolysaccharide-modifying protein n=1 Tax=Artemisia annua TaxID=35608 RepID=A0A2U1N679_ARTAN|nr:lipopolysaccharide-modifying protein [Artemisia annua]